MNQYRTTNIYLIIIFVVATAIVVYFMPRDNNRYYIYEENRPWSYSLLTAPFDITVFRDSATMTRMVDSIDATMVPIFKRNESVAEQVQKSISDNTALSPNLRKQLLHSVNALYRRGIISQQVAAKVVRGTLPEVKMKQGNANVSVPTATFISQRDAYAMLDSIYGSHSEHRTILDMGLAQKLVPNIEEDLEATELYRETLIQPIVAGIGVIQKGERIISQGEIVTPQLYQVLKSYEATLDKVSNNNRTRRVNTLLGQALFVVVSFLLLYGFLQFYYRDILRSAKRVLALMLLVVVFFVFTVVMGRTFRSGIYIVPLAILPAMVMVFYDSRTAFFVTVLEVIMCAVVASFTLEFVLVEIVACTAVLFSLKELSRRSELLRSAFVAFMAYVITYVAVELMTAGSLASLSWRLIGYFAVNAVLISFAYILIFVYEKLFGMMSIVTLVELADINNPLLRRLSMECPGTFQHSMAVSNLATDAARKIDANVQLVRAGALYHDIGKIENPAFFTENQHGVNPHDHLTPEQSASIIVRHVTDGVRLAEKGKIPKVVRDFILQHHGEGRAKYFYTMACRAQAPDAVDPAPYTYPGPNPQSREASILMMADSVEAASRSLPDPTPEAIRNLVNRLVDGQVTDHLHDNSPLSFRDIKIIKESFINRLRSMYHARVQYPAEVNAARPVQPEEKTEPAEKAPNDKPEQPAATEKPEAPAATAKPEK